MYEAKCLVMDYTNHAAPTATQPPPHQLHHQFHQLHPLAPDSSSRWTQYQQLWRQHHMFINGKSCGKESPDKKDDSELWSNVEAQAAFLGPNLWEKTLSYDSDLKYVDLDEFLSENGIPVEGGPGVGGGPGGVVKDTTCGRISPPSTSQPPGMLPKRERSPSPSEPMSPLTINPPSPADSTLSFASSSRDFDPRTRAFSDEELKPQPMVKKSRKQSDSSMFQRKDKRWHSLSPFNAPGTRSKPSDKKQVAPASFEETVEKGGGSEEPSSTFTWQGLRASTQDSDFVPDGLKDEKYWARRRKNNMAAKRSRDARRLKENQIALRAGFLEKENLGLRQEMERLKKENMTLRDRLSKYTTEI